MKRERKTFQIFHNTVFFVQSSQKLNFEIVLGDVVTINNLFVPKMSFAYANNSIGTVEA